MGLSIYYKGRIRDRALLPQLLEAVSDICSELGWEQHRFDEPEAAGLFFAPEGSEPPQSHLRQGRQADRLPAYRIPDRAG